MRYSTSTPQPATRIFDPVVYQVSLIECTPNPGDFDLAAVFGDMLNASALGVSGLVDILP